LSARDNGAICRSAERNDEGIVWSRRRIGTRRRAAPVIETVPKGTARPESGTEAVTRAADVLLLFTGGPASLGVSVAARRLDLGNPHRLHAGASSKAILAFGPPELRRHILSQPHAALTPRTPVSRAALEADLARVSRAGVAVSMGERQPGAASVAAPVCGVDG